MTVFSWFVSLRWIGRSVVRPRRGLEKYGLGAARVPDGLFNAGPCRLVAEARAQIVQQCSNLIVAHAAGKTGHDRTALALHGANARKHDVGGVARVGRADRGA